MPDRPRYLRRVLVWLLLLIPIPLFTWLGYLWNDPWAGVLISVAFVVVLALVCWHVYGFLPTREEFIDGPDESEL